MNGNWGMLHLAGVPFHTRLSRRRMEAMRDRRLRWLVRHAARTTPFYRELFENAGVAPESIRGFGDIQCLPPISKETLRQAGKSAWAEDTNEKRLSVSTTSGSSGEPFTMAHTCMDQALFHAVNLSSLMIYGWRPWHRGMALGSQALPNPHPLQHIGLFRWPYVKTTRPVSEWVDEFESIRPHVRSG